MTLRFSNELHLQFFFYFERTTSTMVLLNEGLAMFVLWKWLNGFCAGPMGQKKKVATITIWLGGWAVGLCLGGSSTDLNGFRTDKRWLGMGCARRSFKTNSTNTWNNMPGNGWVPISVVVVDFDELTPYC